MRPPPRRTGLRRAGACRAAAPAQRAIGDHFDGEDRRHRLLLANRHGPAAAESAVVSTFFRAKPSFVAGRRHQRLEVTLAKEATRRLCTPSSELIRRET